MGDDVVFRMDASFDDAVVPCVQCQLWSISSRREYSEEARHPHGVENTETVAIRPVSKLGPADVCGSWDGGAGHSRGGA